MVLSRLGKEGRKTHSGVRRYWRLMAAEVGCKLSLEMQTLTGCPVDGPTTTLILVARVDPVGFKRVLVIGRESGGQRVRRMCI